MKIGKLHIKVHFYRKNMKIRGAKLWEIIPMNTMNSKGFILSFYFTHIFVDWIKFKIK